MPRTSRSAAGGYCYHVLNRGNARRTVFRKPADYDAFVELLTEAQERMPMRLLAWCLMPNHFHLVLWPRADGDLSRYMMWLMTAQVRRYHHHYRSSGHIWQGRFKSFPIQEDEHLLTVLRYVERNPLRANLVTKAQNWLWSSAARPRPGLPELDPGPVARQVGWLRYLNEPQTEAEVKRMSESIQRGRPYGEASWVKRVAGRLGLESSLRPRGRPRKVEKGQKPSLFE